MMTLYDCGRNLTKYESNIAGVTRANFVTLKKCITTYQTLKLEGISKYNRSEKQCDTDNTDFAPPFWNDYFPQKISLFGMDL